jgi:hypothetical protein
MSTHYLQQVREQRIMGVGRQTTEMDNSTKTHLQEVEVGSMISQYTQEPQEIPSKVHRSYN